MSYLIVATSKAKYDGVVIGSGPNGLAAAIALAQSGKSVLLLERAEIVGGGMSSRPLTLPGFIHDVCSAAHPLAVASPFFRKLPLEKFGLKWIHSPAVAAHPHADGTVTLLKRSVEETAAQLGRDEKNYLGLFGPLVKTSEDLMTEILGPMLHIPKHPAILARFGLKTLLSSQAFAKKHFIEEKTRALFAGMAAHSASPLTEIASTPVGLTLQLAGHSGGWPIPQGGTQNLAKALADYFLSLGGEIQTSMEVRSLNDLPPSPQVFFDLTPRQILKISGLDLSPGIIKSFSAYKYGAGVYKMDWALSAPIPWKARDAAQAATVHLGGTLDEITLSEGLLEKNQYSQTPYVLLCQPSLFDSTRAPQGQHVAWAYCHVPHGSKESHADIIENQIEAFAPGFKKIILKRSVLAPQDLENRNPNLVGGDISGGLINFKQMIFRPRVALDPYALDGKKFWICSSSTPPGPGVHGMCGYHAVQSAMKRGS